MHRVHVAKGTAAPATPQIPTDAATLRRIAVSASADPRSVKRFIERMNAGEENRGLLSDRIRAALVAVGYLPSESK